MRIGDTGIEPRADRLRDARQFVLSTQPAGVGGGHEARLDLAARDPFSRHHPAEPVCGLVQQLVPPRPGLPRYLEGLAIQRDAGVNFLSFSWRPEAALRVLTGARAHQI